MGAAAEFDGEILPFGVAGIRQKIFDGRADGDDADHGWIFFAEDGAESVDFQGLILRGFLGVNGQFFGDGFGD